MWVKTYLPVGVLAGVVVCSAALAGCSPQGTTFTAYGGHMNVKEYSECSGQHFAKRMTLIAPWPKFGALDHIMT